MPRLRPRDFAAQPPRARGIANAQRKRTLSGARRSSPPAAVHAATGCAQCVTRHDRIKRGVIETHGFTPAGLDVIAAPALRDHSALVTAPALLELGHASRVACDVLARQPSTTRRVVATTRCDNTTHRRTHTARASGRTRVTNMTHASPADACVRRRAWQGSVSCLDQRP